MCVSLMLLCSYTQPGKTASQGRFFTTPPPAKVAAVLGAGNVGFLGIIDALCCLFENNQLVLFKPHPIQAEWHKVADRVLVSPVQCQVVQPEHTTKISRLTLSLRSAMKVIPTTEELFMTIWNNEMIDVMQYQQCAHMLQEPLAARGFYSSVYLDTVQDTQAMLYHPDVEHVHMTGGIATHDAIVWGSDPQEQEQRKKNNDPVLKVRLSPSHMCMYTS